MQMFENDTNYAEIAIKPYHVQFSHKFNNFLILSQNLLKTSSFNMYTSSQMRVPLVIVAGKVLYLSAAYPHSLRTCCLISLSGAATTRVHISTSNSPYLNLVAYTTCGAVSVACVEVGVLINN